MKINVGARRLLSNGRTNGFELHVRLYLTLGCYSQRKWCHIQAALVRGHFKHGCALMMVSGNFNHVLLAHLIPSSHNMLRMCNTGALLCSLLWIWPWPSWEHQQAAGGTAGGKKSWLWQRRCWRGLFKKKVYFNLSCEQLSRALITLDTLGYFHIGLMWLPNLVNFCKGSDPQKPTFLFANSASPQKHPTK